MDKWRNFSKQDVAGACLRFGPLLDQYLNGTDDTMSGWIVGSQLLWAIAGNESEFGKNCKPRHEPLYDHGGRYAEDACQSALLDEFGSDAACSWGPWQVMLCNAPGFRPVELGLDLEKAVVATIGYIRRYVLGTQKARTLTEVLDTFNSGNCRDRVTPVVQAYIDKGRGYYLSEVIAIPDGEVSV